jgi:hypothetical protein
MFSKNARVCALSMAIATPHLIGTTAFAEGDKIFLGQAQRMQTAPATREMAPEPAAARQALARELAQLTPEQRRELGSARIDQLNDITAGEIVGKGCFTHGVGCAGIPAFSQGVICCLIIKSGL